MSATSIGVLGVGSLGFHHARLLREIEGARLVGVHDANPTRLAEVGEKLGVATFSESDALLDQVDAVVVAVPTAYHEAVAAPALERGVHVLLEKPVASDVGAARRILTAADKGGAKLQVGHVERFNAALRACEPYLHEPLFVESHRLAPFGPRGTDVAVVLDLMIHDLDLVLSLVGHPVSAIAAMGVPVLTPSPDIANARVEFRNGAVANLTASRVSLERMRKIRFFQRSGYISLDLSAGSGEFLRLRDPGALAAGLAGGGVRLEDIIERVQLTGDGREPLRVELESFLAAVQGRAPIAVTGEEAVAALEVALEIVGKIEDRVAHSHTARA